MFPSCVDEMRDMPAINRYNLITSYAVLKVIFVLFKYARVATVNNFRRQKADNFNKSP